jgi:hypothetical protein
VSNTHTNAAYTLEDRIRTVAEMIVNVELAERELRRAAQQTPFLCFQRNRLRVQAAVVQLGDLARELKFELRKADEIAAIGEQPACQETPPCRT